MSPHTLELAIIWGGWIFATAHLVIAYWPH